MNQSQIFSKYLSDDVMAAVVSDGALIEKMLQFEVALASAQSKLGMIPSGQAEEIRDVLGRVRIQPADLRDGTLAHGTPVLPLLDLIRKELSGDAGDSLHMGATSQDAMDTAQVLMIRDGVKLIESRISKVMTLFAGLTEQYGETPCMARTRGKLAAPVLFSRKISSWISPLKRQSERLNELGGRLWRVQLGGATGDRAAYKDRGEALTEALASELKLLPSASWHTQRDTFCEFTNWLAILAGICGKIGGDILVMSQDEIGEIEESGQGGGKSSAMPHKNNPVLSEALVAMARESATLQAQQLQGLVHLNERDATAWILEWSAIPRMLVIAGTSLNHVITIGTHIHVNTARMKNNVGQFLKDRQREHGN